MSITPTRPSLALWLLGLWLSAANVASGDEAADAVSALREGNRLYREGRLEEALTAYLDGYRPGPTHPVLAYNLGTTAHELERLPEAILWYRRAATVNPGDPWLTENLSQARVALGLQPYPAPGLAGAISRHRMQLALLGALLTCVGTGYWILRPRRGLRPPALWIATGVALYGLVHLAGLVAPRPAVVLHECSGVGADLPPGSEVWITDQSEDGYEVAAGAARLDCPRSAVLPLLEEG